MQRQPQRHYSLAEYFAVEESSTIKHEYYNGEIFAMAGASLTHNHISANVLAALRTALRDSPCSAFGRDLRLYAPSGLYTYPDVMVVCGEIELMPDRSDTVTNPCVLVEVLSEATQDYDRGDKFMLYQAIPTFRDYLLIEQAKVMVEHFQLTEGGVWTSQVYTSLDDVVTLSSINIRLPLAEAYRRVFGT